MDSKNKVILISVIVGVLVIGLIVGVNVSGKAVARQYGCEWGWPQKVIDKNTNNVVLRCTNDRPYCNIDAASSGSAICCATGRAGGYISCINVAGDRVLDPVGIGSCIDGSEKDYYARRSIPYDDGNGVDDYFDYCSDSETLVEFYCSSDTILAWEDYDCSAEDKVCIEGACAESDADRSVIGILNRCNNRAFYNTGQMGATCEAVCSGQDQNNVCIGAEERDTGIMVPCGTHAQGKTYLCKCC